MTVNHSSIAACERELAQLPRLMALHKTVAKRPRLKAYLVSERRGPVPRRPGSSAAIHSWMVSATGSNGATHKESGSRARSFPARQPRRYVRARIVATMVVAAT